MSERLSAWEIEHFKAHGGEPDVSWAEKLPKLYLGAMVLYVYEPIRTKAPCYAHANWCLGSTIQFLRRFGEFHEFDRVEITPRTWPMTHFVLHESFHYEVVGGEVIHDCGWWVKWSAYRNSNHAHHLNGYHYVNERCDLCARNLAPRHLEIRRWPAPKVKHA